jgi:pimeloyl-ACP methyl ester carboxylesterase
MWPRLAEHAHIVAIDSPGFGHSERRNDLLTPSTMGEFVAQVIEEFGLMRPHAVGPDIGTSALLFTAAKYPGLFRSLVVGTTPPPYPFKSDPC